MAKYSKSEREEALARLREELKPGDMIYTILRQTSRSGMSRNISPILIKDGEAWDFGYLAAKVLDRSMAKDGGIICEGCGMDMGFELVYAISAALYGYRNEGAYQLKQRWL